MGSSAGVKQVLVKGNGIDQGRLADGDWGTAALQAKRAKIREYQAKYVFRHESWVKRNRYFFQRILRLYQLIVEPGRKVLNVRCSIGTFLDGVRPSAATGVDVSPEILTIARQRCPEFQFVQSDPENLDIPGTFDYVFLNNPSDMVDVLQALLRVRPNCVPHTRLIIYDYNHLWEPIVRLAELLGLKMPLYEPNWLSEEDLKNLLFFAGFEHVHTYREILIPVHIPLVSEFFNRILARLPGLQRLCLVNVLVAKCLPFRRTWGEISVSVIVPCKNERGNIGPAVRRIPEMGRFTEIIFCDDKSTDGTREMVREMQKAFPHRRIRLVEGPGTCKADNVWTGFEAAEGDMLMVLDADLAVMPEELPHFFGLMVEGKGEFINGTRLTYPMQDQAMGLSNMLGNKFFSIVFSYLLGQRITDTLCGTKVLWRSDWNRLKQFRGSWGVADRWGDYDLLFGATRLGLKIVEFPVHYQERRYGATKMVRLFHNGLRMLGICIVAFFKLKIR